MVYKESSEAIMKFGIMLPHHRQMAGTEAIARVAREAEDMGYDSVWVSDHIGSFPSTIPLITGTNPFSDNLRSIRDDNDEQPP